MAAHPPGALRRRLATSSARRSVTLGPATVAVLKRWRTAQLQERVAAGPAWQGSDDPHLWTNELGEPYRPDSLSVKFRKGPAGLRRPADLVPLVAAHRSDPDAGSGCACARSQRPPGARVGVDHVGPVLTCSTQPGGRRRRPSRWAALRDRDRLVSRESGKSLAIRFLDARTWLRFRCSPAP